MLFPRVASTATGVVRRGGAAYSRKRRQWRWLDEIHRTYVRYYDLKLNRLAGSAVYYGFLASLPFVLLLFFALSSVSPQPATAHHGAAAAQNVNTALSAVTGSGAHGLRAVWDATFRAVLTTFGVSGLVYAAWAWFESLRHAVATAAGRVETRKRIRDFVTVTLDLLMVGPGLLACIFLAWAFTDTPYRLLRTLTGLNVPDSYREALEDSGLALCLLFGMVLWYLVYPRLAGVRTKPVRTLLAAVATSLAVGLLLEAGMALVKANTTHLFFGLLVLIFGLLLWVSVAVRLVLAIGTWLTLPAMTAVDSDNTQEPGEADTRGGGYGRDLVGHSDQPRNPA